MRTPFLWLAGAVVALATPARAQTVVPLDTLDVTQMASGWNSSLARRTVDNQPLTMRGKVYERGVGTHANSAMHIVLNNNAQRFRALVGVDDEVGARGSVVFEVHVNGRRAVRTRVLRGGDAPQELVVSLAGARHMDLLVDSAGDGMDYDHANWANAEIELRPGATERPTAANVSVANVAPPRLAFGDPPQPRIHGPRITGGTPGHAFLFRIPATGEKPLRFSARNLPDGLRLDPQTGIISGTLRKAGRTKTTLTVRGPRGTATGALTIVAGPDALALTPPMGWNSWNVWGAAVDDAKVRAAADELVKSGLADHGYQYINIDDAWQGDRGPDGRLRPNSKFPDMKALADYVHAKGLKLGIYSSPGPRTCANYEGSYQFEEMDAVTYAAWGIDYLKYDWCSYGGIAKDASHAELTKPYHLMRAALGKSGRDIVYSLCQYGMGNVWEWGDDVGGHLWRTTGDITDTWSSMAGIGFGQAGREKYAGPGRWNDPDMLVVGKVGWGPNLRSTRLSPHEQVTHMSLWVLQAAPLLIGADMTQLDRFTLSLLTNDEVLDVNQDPLARAAGRRRQDGMVEVWSRPLSDGTVAVGLFNRGWEPARVTAQWSDVGVKGRQPVRDLWQRRNLGTFQNAFSATVVPHGAMMVKIGTPRETE